MDILNQIGQAAHDMTLAPMNNLRKKRSPAELMALHKDNQPGQRGVSVMTSTKNDHNSLLMKLAGVHY